jgi:hypothetical protein
MSYSIVCRFLDVSGWFMACFGSGRFVYSATRFPIVSNQAAAGSTLISECYGKSEKGYVQ